MDNLINNYILLENELNKAKDNCQHICYGKSTLGENLYAFHKGSKTGKQILITAGIHAREFISSFVALKLLQEYSFPVGVYVLPVCNPDGIKLCCLNSDWIKDNKTKKFLLDVNKSEDFSLWKANINAVDLNVNFDANWGDSKFIKTYPSSSGYLGKQPNSELEVINLLKFITPLNLSLCLSYHSKGEVVYFGHEKLPAVQVKRDKHIGKQIAKILNYKLTRSLGSSGGLSDYLALKRKLPSFTIELGSDNLIHPIDYSHLDDIYKNQMNVLEFANVFTQQYILQQLY